MSLILSTWRTPAMFMARLVLALVTLCLSLGAIAFAVEMSERENLGLNGPVRTVVKRQHEGQPFVFVVRHEFDREGKQVEVISGAEQKGKLTSGLKFKVSRDKSGKITRRESFWIEGRRDQTILYAYDEHGHTIAESISAADRSFESLVVRAYDPRGNWVLETRYSKTSPFVDSKKAEHQYGQDGRRTETVIAQRDGSKTVERYDPRGLVIESVYYRSDNTLESKVQVNYDDNGNQRELFRYGPDGQIDTHAINSYEYDVHGNWVVNETKVLLRDGKPFKEVNRMSRAITYYE